MALNKKLIHILFLCIDIVVIALVTTYSAAILKSELPAFSSQLARYIKDSVNFPIAILLIALYLLFLLYLTGAYKDKLNLSILNHASKIVSAVSITYLSLFIQFFGFLTLFSYENVWSTFLQVFILNSATLILSHIIVILVFRYSMRRGHLSYKTILVGSSELINHSYKNIIQQAQLTGNKIIKIVNIDNPTHLNSIGETIVMNEFNDIEEFLSEYQPDEIIIALPAEKDKLLTKFLSVAKMRNITVKLIPEMDSIMKGFVRVDNLIAPPYVNIANKTLPVWQAFIKRIVDLLLSLIGIICMLPFLPAVVFKIKLSSEGPIFYTQKRIGKNGKPFNIIKFRTMRINAEENGPLLSSEDDERITSFGRFLRRWRLDETPQFLNVIIGHMSIVGPRPERAHFINEISKEAPHFSQILNCRPGITSLGMVKFGYAENVEEMIQRLNYDIIYMENLSLWLDLKILLYTLRTLSSGEGK